MIQKNIEQLIFWKLKTAKTEQGFVTIEVIMALVVGFVFFAFSLQAFAFAIATKVQAQEKQRANKLIQEDIERISQLGSNPGLAGVCDPTGASLAATYNNGYAHGLWTSLINTVPNDDPALRKTIINRIKSDGTSETAGSTLALQRFYVGQNGGAANNANDPHRTLKVGYQVWYWGEDPANPGGPEVYLNRVGQVPTITDDAIAETYVEIIPDVALQCP